MGRPIAILPSIACLVLISGSAFAQCDIERLTPPVGPNGGDFGNRVAFHGESILIADRSAATLCPVVFGCGTGAVYFFQLVAGQWERVQRILPDDVQAGDFYGSSMDLRDDRLIVGSSRADLAGPETGGAYIYDFDGAQWVETGRIPSPRPRAFAGFGRQVVIEGGVALVQQGGTLYVYQEQITGQWVLRDELVSPDGEGGYFGGHSNALTDDWLFVGTPFDDSIAVNVGSVYVFRRDGPTDFVFHQKIDAPDPGRTPRFGSSIATEGNDLFIGGPTADGAFEAEGAVFHFELVDGLWVLRQEITHDDHPDRGDYFGSAISLHGDTLAVSAHLKRTPTTFGVVYVFERGVDGQWSQRARLIPETLSSPFGVAVATNGRRIVAGAENEGVEGSPLGAAHVFDLTCYLCPPDLDADGALTVFDFLLFFNLFDDGDAQADFDGDGELTIFDFLAFQTAFDAGCA